MHIFIIYKGADWLTVQRTIKLLACLLTGVLSDASSFVVYLIYAAPFVCFFARHNDNSLLLFIAWALTLSTELQTQLAVVLDHFHWIGNLDISSHFSPNCVDS